jgi:hypothetical protein
VLPEEASGWKVVTVGQETVTVQACLPAGREGMAQVLHSWQEHCGVRAASRYIPIAIGIDRSQKTVKVLNFNYGQILALTAVASAKAGIRVQQPLQICLE